MDLIKTIGYSLVLIIVAMLLLIKLVIPVIGSWIILAPIVLAAIVALVGFFIGASYELMKVIVRLGAIFLFLFLLMKIFI